jgi:putative RecB family exonuclease
LNTITQSPNAAAEKLTGRDYISFSAINTYRQCPLRYHFRYVLGLPEKTVSAALVFGGAIHSAVELHFREILAGNPAPDLDMLLDAYQEAWKERSPGEIIFGKDDNVSTLGSLAERMLVTFQESDFAEPAGSIIGVEEELRQPLVQGCPDVLARVDLLVDAGDSLVVVDLKTARCRWSQEQVRESSDQLLLYHELARSLADGRPVKLQFAVLTKTKAPALELYDVPVDQGQLERTKRIVEQVWQAIEAGSVYPSPSPMQCPTCPFVDECRGWPA